MREFKEEISLNEEDSLLDLLWIEKTLLKTYAFALTEGVSKGFRETALDNLSEEISDQFSVFALLTELDYVRVRSEDAEKIREIKEKFKKAYKVIKEGQ
jgi:hypothetical protein